MVGSNDDATVGRDILGAIPSDSPKCPAEDGDQWPENVQYRLWQCSRIASRAVGSRSLLNTGRNIQESYSVTIIFSGG